MAQAAPASPARAAGPRYASPTGTSAQNCLTPATACDLVTAISGADQGDEVFVAPGTYATSTTLASNQRGIKVHGYAGQPRPVISSTAPSAVNLTGSGTEVADLTIDHSGPSYGLNVFATNVLVQRVEVHSTGVVACSPGRSGLLRDSLCVTSAAGGIALDDSFGDGNGLMTLRNVTAIATGAGSIGIQADAADETTIVLSGRNVIASGATDVLSRETNNNSESFISLQTSNFDTRAELVGGSVTAPGSGSNQTAQPVFLDPTTYRQAPGSPTIDKGGVDASTGAADLDGDPRGAAPDIGADEFDVTPPDTTFNHTPKAKTHKRKAIFTFTATEAVTFTCKVGRKKAKPCTSPFKVKAKRYGKHKITVTARDAVGNVDPTPAKYKWKIKKKRHRGR